MTAAKKAAKKAVKKVTRQAKYKPATVMYKTLGGMLTRAMEAKGILVEIEALDAVDAYIIHAVTADRLARYTFGISGLEIDAYGKHCVDALSARILKALS